MPIPGNLLTTAMAVMPHKDADRALEVSVSLDVPFWPQLPRLSYYEDMYVQASEHFPGIVLDLDKRSLRFSMEKFIHEFEETMRHFDEPGLQFLFSAMSGYSDQAARRDLETFFSMVERPRGIHLCGNPDWDFLLGLDLDILSLDVYTNGEVFSSYGRSIGKFLGRGGILSWGIVPTNFEPFEKESLESLEKMLTEIWNILVKKGGDLEFVLSRSLLSPATCCLVNPDAEKTVEKAFEMVKDLSARLREKYKI